MRRVKHPSEERGGLSWLRIPDIVAQLGPSAAFLHKAIANKQHPLKHRKVGKWLEFRKNDIKEWIKAHLNQRHYPALKEALDTGKTAKKPRGPAPASFAPPPIEQGSMAVLRSINLNEGTEKAKIKLDIARALRQEQENELEKKKMVKRDDVIRMLRSLGDRYKSIIENHSGVMAETLIKTVRMRTAIDFRDHYAGIVPIVENILREQARDMIFPELTKSVDDEISKTTGGNGNG